jgi:hypothetical protein
MLLRNRNSAIPQSQFFSCPQLESFTSAIFGGFLAFSGLKLHIFFNRQVFFAIERILKGQ